MDVIIWMHQSQKKESMPHVSLGELLKIKSDHKSESIRTRNRLDDDDDDNVDDDDGDGDADRIH